MEIKKIINKIRNWFKPKYIDLGLYNRARERGLIPLFLYSICRAEQIKTIRAKHNEESLR